MAELKLQQALWATSAGLVCLVLLLQWYFGKFRRAVKGLPPGTMGWPFIGETLQLVSAYKTTNPEPFVDIRRSRYGNVFRTHVFGKPTIFSTDPEVNKFILQNEGKLFVTSYPSSIANLMGKQSLLLMRGNLHKRLHSLTMSFANSSVLKDHLMFDIVEEHETIRRRKGEHERLEWDDYKSMTFTQCVISETLRIANIIGGVFRRALCDVEIKGYTIPKDWMVFPSFRAVHLDQDLYSDARKFNPWRWQVSLLVNITTQN